jgi:hypothetical protein
MTLNSSGLVNALSSLGAFDRVNTHEPKNAPGDGISCVIWLDTIGPAKGESGLSQTSALITFAVRVQTPFIGEPNDDIDTNLMDAVDQLFTAYSGDFDLNGLARYVDLLGSTGNGLSGKAGYLNQDGKIYRVFTITLPMIVDGVWEQVE